MADHKSCSDRRSPVLRLATEGVTHNHDTKFKNTVEKRVQKTATIADDEKSPAIKTFGKRQIR